MAEHGWTGQRVLDLAWGFDRAAVLVAAADLGIFGLLGGGSMSAEQLAQGIDADKRGTAVLLDALVAIGLLERRGDEYRNADGVDKLLAEDGAQSVFAMVRHAGACMRRWAQLEWAVKSGRQTRSVPSVRGPQADADAFIEAMHVINRHNAEDVLDKLEGLKIRKLLDVGGGSGTWAIAFLRKRPDARAVIFDLPDVVELAHGRIGQAGLTDRVEIAGGDYLEGPLPGPVDAALLSAVVHQNSREENRKLFENTWQALEPGGVMIVRDVLMSSASEPVEGALFAVNMLVATDGGGTYTFEQLEQDIAGAGFEQVEIVHRDAYMNSLVTARKP